jgi:predicted outer membrane repeat protein
LSPVGCMAARRAAVEPPSCAVPARKQPCTLPAAPHPNPLHPPHALAVSTSAETWFVGCSFERNIAGQYGGAILLEGGCPAAFFLNYWFKASGRGCSKCSLKCSKAVPPESHGCCL